MLVGSSALEEKSEKEPISAREEEVYLAVLSFADLKRDFGLSGREIVRSWLQAGLSGSEIVRGILEVKECYDYRSMKINCLSYFTAEVLKQKGRLAEVGETTR